jgi:hypothetical protein
VDGTWPRVELVAGEGDVIHVVPIERVHGDPEPVTPSGVQYRRAIAGGGADPYQAEVGIRVDEPVRVVDDAATGATGAGGDDELGMRFRPAVLRRRDRSLPIEPVHRGAREQALAHPDVLIGRAHGDAPEQVALVDAHTGAHAPQILRETGLQNEKRLTYPILVVGP